MTGLVIRRESCLVVTVEKPNENIMDSNTDYERYDGLGLAGLVKDGSVSADELLEAVDNLLAISMWPRGAVPAPCAAR